MVGVHTATVETTQDYFKLLLRRARSAAAEGNYAISAALVIREAGREAVFEGWNTLFAEGEPSGHAEMNAIRLAHAAARLPDQRSEAVIKRARELGALHMRAAPNGEAGERILYTTLEPCPMCTVCIINAGIDHVIVAAEDPPSGALENSRLRQLPPIWHYLAQAGGLRISFCQSADPCDTVTYIAEDLRQELVDRFHQSREALDQTLGDSGVLDFHAAAAHVWAIMDER